MRGPPLIRSVWNCSQASYHENMGLIPQNHDLVAKLSIDRMRGGAIIIFFVIKWSSIYVQVDFLTQWERESDRGGENQRWQIGSLATCVRRPLKVDQACLITGKPTMETRSTNVLSATNHLWQLLIWRDTSSFTLGRNRTSAHNVTLQPIMFPIFECTLRNTLERNHINATNATLLQFNQVVWSNTKEPTLEKSLTDAQCASFPAFKLVNWRSTWWGNIQEKSHSSVTSATTLVSLLVICSNTWGRTVGKSPSGATNAAKLTRKRKVSQNISEFKQPRFKLLIWSWNTKPRKWPTDNIDRIFRLKN